MTPEWRDFLTREGAVFDAAGGVLHFGDPEAERQAAADAAAGGVIVDLSPLSVIRVQGPDAQAFLHAQLTNDLRRLEARRSQLAAWCNAQGRMLALMRVWRRGEAFLLLLPTERRDAVLERLRRFVLRAQVELDSLDTTLARLGVSGLQAARLLRETVGFAPEGPDAALTENELSVLALPAGPFSRYLLAAPFEQAAALWQKFSEHGLRPAGFEVWTWLDIQAGLPQIYDATAEAFIPQMVNLDLLGGVSFSKGCYPGQEIVSRLHHRGGLKQRLYRLHVHTPAAPPPGTPVYSPAQAGERAGSVVHAAPSPKGGCDLLAVIQIACAEAGDLRLGAALGPPLVSVPDADAADQRS